MDVDWTKPHSNDLQFIMVSPTNLSEELGEISGVLTESASLSWGYYTDTRVSGSLELLDTTNYVRGNFIRIYHSIPEWNYRRPLATLIPSEDPMSLTNNHWMTKLSLQSILWSMDKDVYQYDTVVKNGQNVLDCLHAIIKSNHVRQYVDNNPNTTTYNNVYTFDGSQLSRAFAMAKDSHNRLDVDGYGNVVISPYTAPSRRDTDHVLDLEDQNGIITNEISVTNDFLSRPNRVIVEHTFNDNSNQIKVVGVAEIKSENATGINRRGFVISDVHTISNVDDHSQWYVNNLAKTYLDDDQRELTTWSLQFAMYFPCTEGDRIDIISSNKSFPGVRKCIVKSTDLSLTDMTMKVVLKEISADDKGDK